MPKQNHAYRQADNQEQLSEVIFSWQAPEDVRYYKGVWWYIISLVILGLVSWWAVAVNNLLFAVFLILFYLVVLISERRQPEVFDFSITPDGVKWGNNFYFYKEFNYFYVVYEEKGVKNLYLEFRNPLRGRLIVDIEGQDAVAIREYLLDFLNEDLEREAEPLSERIRRWLRL